MSEKLKVPPRVYKAMENEYKRAAASAEAALAKAEAKKKTLDAMEIDTAAEEPAAGGEGGGQ